MTQALAEGEDGIADVLRRSGHAADSTLFSSATTAAQVLQRLDASSLAAGEKQQYRLLIAMICDAKMMKTRDYLKKKDANKPVLSAARKLSSSFSYEYFEEFCNVPGIEMGQVANGFEAIDPSDETVQANELVNLEESGEPALASQRALDLLSNSTSAAAVSRAMDFLAGMPTVSPLGSDLPFPEATAQENFDAHRIAAARWSCEHRGGCGPGEFFSVVACQGLGNCQPGITIDAAWRQGYRPGVLVRAEEIHRRLAVRHAKSDSARRVN